ncbi:MAG: glutathione S-transferase N-terminal domain-containing protein [Verrucomicrobiota bacterium]
MLKFYYSLAPNPMKVALFLEEAEIEYEAVPVDTRKGEQHAADFLEVNPNGKLPVIVDGNTTVFDSNAIMLYLAEKTGKFLPAAEHRGEVLSWLMFIATGVGPYSGQAVHFKHMAPEKIAYAMDRYQFEAERHYQILDDRLAKQPYLIGDSYSFVDMTLWGWSRMAPFVIGDTAWDQFPNVARLQKEISARPAAERAEAIKEKHKFKSDLDDEARKNLFRHLK